MAREMGYGDWLKPSGAHLWRWGWGPYFLNQESLGWKLRMLSGGLTEQSLKQIGIYFLAHLAASRLVLVQQVSDALGNTCSLCLPDSSALEPWFAFSYLSPRDPKRVAAAPDDASAFKAGRKEEEPRCYQPDLFPLVRKAKPLPEVPTADFCLGPVFVLIFLKRHIS